MATYGWTEDYVRIKLTAAKAWVYYNWAKENSATMLGALYQRSSDGYVAQERKKWVTQEKSQ